MSLEAIRTLAVEERLYPAVILHGGDDAARRAAALRLARTLLCDAAPGERPCGACRHCRRIGWSGAEAEDGTRGGGVERYHPDFHVLERDLKSSTSVEATRSLLAHAHVTPYEARGQVFVVASAESLTGQAADALLKTLEEPPSRAPRHFFLLAPSRLDLLPTIRSRSLAFYLGGAAEADPEVARAAAGELARLLGAWVATGAGVYLLAAARSLAGAGEEAGGWDDARSGAPWAAAARAVVGAASGGELPATLRRPLLALAADLLAAPEMRLRAIPAQRILDGLVARHVAAARRP